MDNWLFEGRTTVYVILAALAAICLFLWQQDRHRRWLIACGVFVGLGAFYFLLDVLVETDHEQIQRRVQALADGVRESVRQHSVQGMLQHISQSFRPGGHEGFRSLAGRAIDSGQVEEVAVWGIEFPVEASSPESRRSPPAPRTEARVEFMAKPKGSAPFDPRGYFIRATFVREEGQWRLRDFQVLSVGDQPTPLRIPGVQE
jgi:hypothetical protein